MKQLYWSSRKVTRKSLVVVLLLALAGLYLVERFPAHVERPHYQDKVAAAQRAAEAMRAIKHERLRRGHTFDPELDPTQTGMLGEAVTEVTTAVGHLPAKQHATDPNFAAVVVELLRQAGVQPGDCVAIGYSGSFPSMNICVLSALEQLQLVPVIVASVGSSQYGANVPGFLWPDMEKHLYDQHFIRFRSVAASLGGTDDRALGLEEAAQQEMRDAVLRNDLPLIESVSIGASIDTRMRIYDQYRAGQPIKAYVNVGGNTVSVGRRLGKSLFKRGLNTEPPPNSDDIDAVITRFLRRHIPVIHLVGFTQLAERHGLPKESTATTPIGTGPVYADIGYNRWLTAAVLLVILATLKVFVVSDLGIRLMGALTRRPRPLHLFNGRRDVTSETPAPSASRRRRHRGSKQGAPVPPPRTIRMKERKSRTKPSSR